MKSLCILPKMAVFKDRLDVDLSQKPGARLSSSCALSHFAEVTGQIDQELVVRLRHAGGVQDPLYLMTTILQTCYFFKKRQEKMKHLLGAYIFSRYAE